MTDSDDPRDPTKYARSLQRQHKEMLRVVSYVQRYADGHSPFLDAISKSVAASVGESHLHFGSVLAQIRHAAGAAGANGSSFLDTASLKSALEIRDRLRSLQPYNELVAQLAKLTAPASIPGHLGAWSAAALSDSASKWHSASVSEEIGRLIERHSGLLRGFPDHLWEIERACGAIDALHRIQDAFPGALSATMIDTLNRLGTLGATFSSLTHGAGLLAEMDPTSGTSGLLWPSAHADRFNAGFLRATREDSPQPSSRHVQIDGAVQCAICGAEMFSSGGSGTWRSDAKIEVKIAVFPLCLSCRERMYEDPELIFELAYDEATPRFELIEGGQETSSTSPPMSRNHLRIVRVEDDSEE